LQQAATTTQEATTAGEKIGVRCCFVFQKFNGSSVKKNVLMPSWMPYVGLSSSLLHDSTTAMFIKLSFNVINWT
jgi:hypothetical protein